MATAVAKSENAKSLETQAPDLPAKNKKLKTSDEQPKPKTRPWTNLIRKLATITLFTISLALLVSANLFFWFGNTVVKQDRFVAATQPIIKDPTVQSSIALYATNNVFKNTDVQGFTEQVLPPKASFLAPQLTNQLKSFTQSGFQRILASPAFQTRWNNISARQHQRLISFASKYQGDGDISLNNVYGYLADSLSNTKLAFLADKPLPAKVGDIKVISAARLPAFHNLVVHIDAWRLVTLFLLTATLAAAVWLSRNRRKTIYWFSAGASVMMLVTLVALHVTRDSIIAKVDPQYQDGVRQVIQIVFHSLVAQTITVMALAIFVGLVAWVSGASNSAISLKRRAVPLFSSRLHQQAFGSGGSRFVGWAQVHKRSLEWLSVAIFGTIMLLVRLTLKGLFIYALAIAACVLLIEFVSGQAAD
jgi:hypothetical protein